jgi:hypothetical protein
MVASFMKMITDGRYTGVEFIPIFETGIYIDEIRNRIGVKFLKTDADFLFFLDYDNGLPIDWLELFMEDFEDPKVKIVSGAYYFKNELETLVAGIHRPELPEGTYLWLPKHAYSERLVNLSSIPSSDAGIFGNGCLMLRREVLEHMLYPWWETRYGPGQGGVMFWGEDTGFCRNAEAAGIDLYIDLRIKSPHMAGDKCYPEEWRQCPKDGLPDSSPMPQGVHYR